MRYGSMFSGIECASVAWKPLGWTCSWVCEIEKFPSMVLAHRYPDVPNLGDVTKVNWDEIAATRPVELIIFGSPCQSYSVAGKRLGLDDPRGNLALVGLGVVARLRPRWFVFENVPGLLSSDGGRDFGTFLGVVGQLGYGFSYRVLDAQFFGVPQRRRRVFVVGHLGGWTAAAAVLFERASLRGDSPPSRATGQEVAGSLGGGSGERGWCDDFDRSGAFIPETAHGLTGEGFDASEDGTGRGPPLVAGTLNANGKAAGSATQQDAENGMLVVGGGSQSPIDTAPCLTSHGGRFDFDTEAMVVDTLRSTHNPAADGAGVVVAPVPILEVNGRDPRNPTTREGTGIGRPGDPMFTLKAGKQNGVIAFDEAQITSAENRSNPQPGGPAPTLSRDSRPAPTLSRDSRPALAFHHTQTPVDAVEMTPALGATADGMGLMTPRWRVRRLTPRECERLMALPDDYTKLDEDTPDGPRYRACGNGMVATVMRWIAQRIDLVEAVLAEAPEKKRRLVIVDVPPEAE